MNRSSHPAAALMLACLAVPTACKQTPQGNDLDTIDNQLVDDAATGNGHGNAAAGLRSAIRVDPAAATRAAGAETASGQGDCLGRYGAALGYAPGWAAKLPADLPLPPAAHLTEAAGHDGGCAIRAVSFTLPGTPDAALAWYEARARAAGYTADRETRGGTPAVAGTKGKAAYYVIANPSVNGATPVDYIWAASD